MKVTTLVIRHSPFRVAIIDRGHSYVSPVGVCMGLSSSRSMVRKIHTPHGEACARIAHPSANCGLAPLPIQFREASPFSFNTTTRLKASSTTNSKWNSIAMNTAFREYVTATSFNLTITKTQIHALWAVKAHNYARGLSGGTDVFVPAVHGLIRRGLVIHHPAPEYGYDLTEAGELVYKLLEQAGLVQVYEERAAA